MKSNLAPTEGTKAAARVIVLSIQKLLARAGLIYEPTTSREMFEELIEAYTRAGVMQSALEAIAADCPDNISRECAKAALKRVEEASEL